MRAGARGNTNDKGAARRGVAVVAPTTTIRFIHAPLLYGRVKYAKMTFVPNARPTAPRSFLPHLVASRNAEKPVSYFTAFF